MPTARRVDGGGGSCSSSSPILRSRTIIPGAMAAEEVRQNVALLEETIPPALWADLKEADLLRNDAPVPHGP